MCITHVDGWDMEGGGGVRRMNYVERQSRTLVRDSNQDAFEVILIFFPSSFVPSILYVFLGIFTLLISYKFILVIIIS